jgi:hypothetical protein
MLERGFLHARADSCDKAQLVDLFHRKGTVATGTAHRAAR